MSPKRTVRSSNVIPFNCLELLTPTMPYVPTIQPDVQPYNTVNLQPERLNIYQNKNVKLRILENFSSPWYMTKTKFLFLKKP
jgi:hypothetical protein